MPLVSTQRIVMTATRKGASDGHTVREYAEGQAYEVSDDLANDFIAAGVAKPASAKKPEAATPAKGGKPAANTTPPAKTE